ncbi:MAG: Gfo/Idh/MocA family protein [Armatimonadota bacterium]
MQSAKPIGIGVIGTGGWARGFWGHASSCSDVRLVSCCDVRPVAARSFAERFGCQADENVDALLARSDVEAVAIYTPNNHHRQPAEAAAAAGKHVFTDKPIANAAQDAAAMIRACRTAGVTLMVGHSDRYGGPQRAIRSVIDSGRLGIIAMAEAHTSHSGGARLSAEEWRWHRADAPGGPLMQLSVHAIDTLHSYFGPTRRVTALSNSSLVPSEIEDVFLALLEFESGLLAYVGTNYVAPACRYFRVYGMNANLFWENQPEEARPHLLRLVGTSTPDSLSVPDLNAHAAEMTEFARAIRTGTPPETGGKEGLRALGVVLAAIKSAEGRRSVEVSEALGEAVELLG